MSIQLIIVCVYIALLFGISFYVKRRADKGSTEYLFAGRKLSAGLIAVNITGLAVGAASTVGVAENAFKVGMAAGWYNAAWAAGAVVMGLVAAGKLRAMKISTIPEFFEKYYDTKGRVISAVGLVIIMSVITALQYLAGGAILASLLPDIFSFKGGMMMSAVVFIGITLIGGLWSSGLSNIVSVCLIYVGVLYSCFAAVNNAGGIENIAAQLPPTLDWFDPLAGIPMAVIIGWFIVMVTQAITAQGPVQIACGARDAKTARKGFLLGGILIFPIGFLCALLGIVAKVSFPDITATMALPKVVMSLNPVASGTTLAALWAADVSTACTILLGAGTLFSQDIYKRFINPSVSDEKICHCQSSDYFRGWFDNLVVCLQCRRYFEDHDCRSVDDYRSDLCLFYLLCLRRGCAAEAVLFIQRWSDFLGLVVWEFVQALHVLQHVIYFEWLICIVTFLIVAVVDKTPIKVPEYVEEEA